MLKVMSDSRIKARQQDMGRTRATAEDARRRRTGETLRLRQDKREEMVLSKRRRNITPECGANAESPEVITKRLSLLPMHIDQLFSDDLVAAHSATNSLRQLLSLETRPPIQQCIDAKILPRLVEFLKMENEPSLNFEAAWVLTNIASGSTEHTTSVIEAGAVPPLIKLMSSKDGEVRGQAVWALANISGDCPQTRDYVLRHGIMTPLLALLNAPNPAMGVLRDATWTLSNLCRGKDAPWDIVSAGSPALSRLLYSADCDVLADACWALVFMTENDPSRCKKLLDDGIGPQIVGLLRHPSTAVQLPAMRVVGTILVSDDEEQTQAMLNMNVLMGLDHLLRSEVKKLRKEAAWCLSNITAGTISQIQSFLEFDNLVEKVGDAALNGDYDTSRECAVTLANALAGGDIDQVRKLVNLGVLQVVARHMDTDNERSLKTFLDAVDHTLNCGLRDPSLPADFYVTKMEQSGIVDGMEELVNHNSDAIYEYSAKILKTHWVPVDENTCPNINADGNNYSW